MNTPTAKTTAAKMIRVHRAGRDSWVIEEGYLGEAVSQLSRLSRESRLRNALNAKGFESRCGRLVEIERKNSQTTSTEAEIICGMLQEVLAESSPPLAFDIAQMISAIEADPDDDELWEQAQQYLKGYDDKDEE